MEIRRRFVDDRWLAREHTALWSRCWIAAASADRLTHKGDTVVTSVGPYPALVVHDGVTVRAFHNVCPHRGHPICEANGTHKRLRCPYHHWTFALDGQRIRRPDPEDFADEGRGLTPISVESFAGLIWLRLDPQGPSLQRWLGDMAPLLSQQGMARMTLTSHVLVELACNWKLSVEVHLESYHVHALHSEVLGWVDDTAAALSVLGPHGAMTVPLAQPSRRLASPSGGMLGQQLARMGIDPAGMTPEAQRAAFGAAALASLAARGADVSALTADQLLHSQLIQLFPNVQLNCYGDRIMLFRHHPHPTDPTRCRFEQQIFELAPASSVPDVRPRTVAPDDPSIGPVTGADLRVAQNLQRSVISPAFRPDWGAQERLVQHFHQQVSTHVCGPDVGPQGT